MFVQCESGHIINVANVQEFGIRQYHLDLIPAWPTKTAKKTPHYDLIAFGVGKVVYAGEQVFADEHRYIIQHATWEMADAALKELAHQLAQASPFVSFVRFKETQTHLKECKEALSERDFLNVTEGEPNGA